ncbi:molybdopterin molybdotransferase MoeA [Candidatus Pelagibacter communis]|uniref:molybdopterin molybdotransferase MoeA n=1 Tax=Pelagibacter ubique TaxID=198252 RepID=UPI00094C1922|nr:molybdopterin molybdotransferase MoeA [Candidatus Pelagibacter ubique]
MNSYKAAISKLNNNSLKIGSEIVSIKDALNRISSKEVIAKSDYPADDNTAFDGFAVNSKETKNTFQKFKILKTIAAGDNPYIKKVPKLSCIEVMTGAIIKKPFDTIIPIEDIEFFPSKQNAKYIIINKKIKKSEFIRPKGSDYKKGNKIIRKGELINPAHILSLKTLGIDKVLVKKKVNIVFYPSGNELSDKKNIPSWKIRNSNTIYLNSLIKSLPVNFTVQKILRDKDQKLFKKQISKKLKSKTDILITSGAVSKGKFDFIPSVINQFKLKNHFKGVAIRPGKPIMFAKFNNNKCFFGLPGNPISSVACFRFFVIPLLFKSLGLKAEKPIFAKLKNKFSKKKKFTRFVKGKLTFDKKGLVQFEVFEGQESYKIEPFVKSNAWGVFKDGVSVFNKGNLIDVYSASGLNEFLIN